MPIIFLTGHADIPTTVRALKAGAVEFFTKPFSVEAMLEAISTAITRSGAALADVSELSALRASDATLSPREREVMALVVAG